MPNLTILNTKIHTLDNLYSLNDLHKISGGENEQRPALFLRNEKTKALVIEIELCADIHRAIKTKHTGKNQGSYACKALVYAYALWISPQLHLQVIRSFDDLHNKALSQPINTKKLAHPLAYLPARDPSMAGYRCFVSYDSQGEMESEFVSLPKNFKFINNDTLAKDMTQVLQALERIDSYARLQLFAPVFKASK